MTVRHAAVTKQSITNGTKRSEVNPNGVNANDGNTNGSVPHRYTDFVGQYINGDWRPGRRGPMLADTDPYTGETLTEIALADQSDLDEAY